MMSKDLFACMFQLSKSEKSLANFSDETTKKQTESEQESINYDEIIQRLTNEKEDLLQSLQVQLKKNDVRVISVELFTLFWMINVADDEYSTWPMMYIQHGRWCFLFGRTWLAV